MATIDALPGVHTLIRQLSKKEPQGYQLRTKKTLSYDETWSQ